MDPKIEKLKLWMSGKKVGPYLVEIWPTNRCNLKCLMCGTWAHRRQLEKQGIRYDPLSEIRLEVSKNRLLKLVKEAKDLNVKEFLITGGGEPFIRKNTTLKLMERIKKQKMFGNLNTNGTLLSKKDIEKIVSISWDIIMFSVDAPDAKTHDFIRGVPGTFSKLLSTISYFNKTKKKLKKDKPKIVFNTVLTNRIHTSLDKMIEFASNVGCESITFIPLIAYDEISKILEFSTEQKKEFKKNAKKAIKISKELGINTNLESLLNPKFDKKRVEKEIEKSPKDFIHSLCFEPFLHLIVKGNGETTACPMLEGSPENIKEKTLKQIWFGDYFDSLRRRFINRKMPNECENCVFMQFERNKIIREKLSI